jgi:hypothetical protein
VRSLSSLSFFLRFLADYRCRNSGPRIRFFL